MALIFSGANQNLKCAVNILQQLQSAESGKVYTVTVAICTSAGANTKVP